MVLLGLCAGLFLSRVQWLLSRTRWLDILTVNLRYSVLMRQTTCMHPDIRWIYKKQLPAPQPRTQTLSKYARALQPILIQYNTREKTAVYSHGTAPTATTPVQNLNQLYHSSPPQRLRHKEPLPCVVFSLSACVLLSRCCTVLRRRWSQTSRRPAPVLWGKPHRCFS